MNRRLQKLKQERIKVFFLCIAYFLVLLAVGILAFLKDASWGNLLIVGCLAGYLFLVRPALKGYQGKIRSAMLLISAGECLKHMQYDPQKGFSGEELEKTGLTPVPLKTSFSRERIQGRSGIFGVTAADVTFPFHNGSMNEMFSGCAIHLETDLGIFPELRIEAGVLKIGTLSQEQQQLVERLEEMIPGCLHLYARNGVMDLFLRGRFLGFRINPLMEITEENLSADPLPELKTSLQMARITCQT